MSRQPYPSDLTNAQWKLIRPVLPAANAKGRPRKYDLREVVNGILYVNSGNVVKVAHFGFGG